MCQPKNNGSRTAVSVGTGIQGRDRRCLCGARERGDFRGDHHRGADPAGCRVRAQQSLGADRRSCWVGPGNATATAAAADRRPVRCGAGASRGRDTGCPQLARAARGIGRGRDRRRARRLVGAARAHAIGRPCACGRGKSSARGQACRATAPAGRGRNAQGLPAAGRSSGTARQGCGIDPCVASEASAQAT